MRGDDDPEQWQRFSTFAITDFFDMLKEEYRTLEVVGAVSTLLLAQIRLSVLLSSDHSQLIVT